jgi:hypothetical protein
MILSGIIAASGKKAAPPSPDPPPAPVYQIVSEPNADGSAGGSSGARAVEKGWQGSPEGTGRFEKALSIAASTRQSPARPATATAA